MKYFPKPAAPTCVAFFALLWAACESTTKPTAGDLLVGLSTPNTDDRAAQLTIQCTQPPVSVSAKAGYLVYSDLGGSNVTLILVRQGGQSIPSHADVATVRVQDVSKSCTASLTSVAFQGYGVRTSFVGYSVSVKP